VRPSRLTACVGYRADWLAVRSDCGNDLATRAAIAQWINDHRDLVSGFQTARLPPVTNQLDWRAHLDAPLHGWRVRVFGIRHEQLNPAMRIVPLKFLHGADERHLLFQIEHRVRVVRERRSRAKHGDYRHQQSESMSANERTVSASHTREAGIRVSHGASNHLARSI